MTVDAALLSRLLETHKHREAEVTAIGRSFAADQAGVLPVLDSWLDEQTANDDALDLVCWLLLGIASVAPLAAHRHLYSRICRASEEPATIRSSAVQVLALSLASPTCEYAVKLHGRHVFRKLHEQRDQLALSPEALDALASSGVGWEPVPIESLDEAWAILVAMTTTDCVDVVPAARCPNVWEELENGSVVAGDAAIAEFITTHPRAFELEILVRVDELANMPTTDRAKRALAHLLDTGFRTPPMWARTHAVYDATLGLQLFNLAQTRDLLDAASAHNSFHVARAWLERDPAGYDALSREMVDIFRGLTEQAPLPEILPAELDQQSPAQIEEALARYCGITVPQLYARLLPGSISSEGFIQPGEHLGALIANDAATLRSLGISRFELADRLAEVIGQGRLDDEWHDYPPWQVHSIAFMGHQHDPFHIYDAYGLNGRLGAVSFAIRKGDLELRGGDLQLSLIRRACFFGGPGCYRIDPALAVEVLGLGS